MRGWRQRALASALVLAATAGAQDGGATPERTANAEPTPTASTSAPDLLRLVAITGIIGGLIYLTAYGLRRFGGNARRGFLGQSASMEVVESLALGGRRFLLIVRVGKQYVLVGATDQGVNHLCDLPAFSGAALGQGEGFRELVGRHARALGERVEPRPRDEEPEPVEGARPRERAASRLL